MCGHSERGVGGECHSAKVNDAARQVCVQLFWQHDTLQLLQHPDPVTFASSPYRLLPNVSLAQSQLCHVLPGSRMIVLSRIWFGTINGPNTFGGSDTKPRAVRRAIHGCGGGDAHGPKPPLSAWPMSVPPKANKLSNTCSAVPRSLRLPKTRKL